MSKVRLHWSVMEMMLNTIGRSRGWSDTPLTAGELGIQNWELLERACLQFDRAYSSGFRSRTIQTMGIILEELGLQKKIPTAWTSESVSGALVVLMGPMMGTSYGVDSRIFNVDHVHHCPIQN